MAFRLVPDNVNINFIQCWKTTLLFSCVLTILLPIFISIHGINMGIDFTGGILMEIRSEEDFSIADINKQLIEKGLTGFTAQSLNPNQMIIRFKDNQGIIDEVLVKKIKEALEGKLKDIIYCKVDYVGPQVSYKQIVRGGISIVMALVGISFYILLRFNWQFSLSATISLIHDVVLVLWFISISNIELNLSAIAALLTVIGYSINDSVIIYDRIRENLKRLEGKSLQEIVNTSINSTLSRTILISGTTLLASLPLVLICNGTVKDFSTIIFFGILAGTYSSIFISAPMLVCSKEKEILKSPS